MENNNNNTDDFLLIANQEVISGQFVEINASMENSEANCSGSCRMGTCMV